PPPCSRAISTSGQLGPIISSISTVQYICAVASAVSASIRANAQSEVTLTHCHPHITAKHPHVCYCRPANVDSGRHVGKFAVHANDSRVHMPENARHGPNGPHLSPRNCSRRCEMGEYEGGTTQRGR